MPTRKLEDSDAARTAALDAIQAQYTATPPAERALTPDQFAVFTARRAAWKAAIGPVATALYNANQANTRKEALGQDLETICSHFFQVFNLAIIRKEFPAAARVFYKLDINDNTVPSITSHLDRINWAQNIVQGEADRALAEGPGTPATLDSGLRLDEGVHADSLVGGYKPMAMPSADQVAAALAAYNAAVAAASPLRTLYDNAQKAVEVLRPGLITYIGETWDDIEYFFRHEAPASLRRKARDWGVTYKNRPGEPEDPTPPAPPPPPNPTP